MAKKYQLKEFSKRSWLNASRDQYGLAAIKTSVDAIKANCEYESASGTIQISDCSRTIYLEFYQDGNYKNALRKIDILMQEIGEFRGKFQDAIDAAEQSVKDGKVAKTVKKKKKGQQIW